MYKINKTATEFHVTFDGQVMPIDVKRWRDQSAMMLITATDSFGLVLDLRAITTIGAEAQEAMLEGCKLYKQKGMSRLAMILSQPALVRQLRRRAQQSGSYTYERYIDAVTNTDPAKAALDWVRKGFDPDPPLRSITVVVPFLGLILSRNNAEIDLQRCVTLAVSQVFESTFSIKPKLLESQKIQGDDSAEGTSSETVTGAICLQLTDGAARHLAGTLHGVSQDEAGSDTEVADFVGEIFSIFSIRFRAILAEVGLMCVPGNITVKRSDSLNIERVPGSFGKRLVFDCLGQRVAVEVHTHFSKAVAIAKVVPKRKILLVDNNRSTRQLIAQAFEPFDTQIFHAETGAEAVTIALREKPDVLFLDIFMADMGALVLLAKLRGNPELKQIPVILVTSATGDQQKPKSPIVGFLVKPFTDESVIATITKVFPLRNLPRSAGNGTPTKQSKTIHGTNEQRTLGPIPFGALQGTGAVSQR